MDDINGTVSYVLVKSGLCSMSGYESSCVLWAGMNRPVWVCLNCPVPYGWAWTSLCFMCRHKEACVPWAGMNHSEFYGRV